MIELLFWVFLALATYSYFLYPLLLLVCTGDGSKAAALAQNTAVDPEVRVPAISLIITVHNEERRIREKLENSLQIEYPGQLEIIVASDHSSDGTESIVSEYFGQSVKLVRADKRLGKEYAQYCAIQAAEGEVLVFSDVATGLEPDALEKMMSYFEDPDVGAVSSEDRFISRDNTVVGESAYVRYEMWLRKMESRAAGLVGLSGSFFAARASICDEWDFESPSDFNTALNCAKAGKKAVTAPDVFGYYQDLSDSKKEFQRKVRTALRGMTALSRHPEVLNPFKFGFFALQVWSHKVMRWMVPWLLTLVFALNLLLLESGWIYQLAFLGQCLFYGTAFAAHHSEGLKRLMPAKIVYFFVQVNIALAQSSLMLISGKRMTVWQPSKR